MEAADQESGKQSYGNCRGDYTETHRLAIALHRLRGKDNHHRGAQGTPEGNHRSARKIDATGNDDNCRSQR